MSESKKSYILTVDGKPQVVRGKPHRGHIVDDVTLLPVIDEERLARHPHKAELQLLIDAAQQSVEAASEEVENYGRTRLNVKHSSASQVNMYTESLRQQRRKIGEHKYTKEHEQQRRGVNKAVEALWSSPYLDDVTFQEPQPKPLWEKLSDGDGDYTPQDLEEISRDNRARLIFAAGVSKSVYRAMETILGVGGNYEDSRQATLNKMNDMEAKVKSEGVWGNASEEMRHTLFKDCYMGMLDPVHSMDIKYRLNALCTLFDDVGAARGFLRSQCIGKQTSFIFGSDIQLPLQTTANDIDWNLAAWKQFVKNYGGEAVKLLPYAREIEAQFAAENAKITDGGDQAQEFGKCSLLRLKTLKDKSCRASDIDFRNLAHDHPEVASFCAKWGVPTVVGQECVRTWNDFQNKKSWIMTQDRIPDIGIIDGKDLNAKKFSSYYMMKLPKEDMRGLVIPTFIPTVCTGADSFLAKSHMLRPEVGLYVIMRKKTSVTIDPEHDQIVAKTSVIRACARDKDETELSQCDALAFNAWERVPEVKSLCVPFFKEAALRAMKADPSVQRVVMGKTVTGHDRSEWKDFDEISMDQRVKLANCLRFDRDLDTQYLVASREKDLVAGAPQRRIGQRVGKGSVAAVQPHDRPR